MESFVHNCRHTPTRQHALTESDRPDRVLLVWLGSCWWRCQVLSGPVRVLSGSCQSTVRAYYHSRCKACDSPFTPKLPYGVLCMHALSTLPSLSTQKSGVFLKKVAPVLPGNVQVWELHKGGSLGTVEVHERRQGQHGRRQCRMQTHWYWHDQLHCCQPRCQSDRCAQLDESMSRARCHAHEMLWQPPLP